MRLPWAFCAYSFCNRLRLVWLSCSILFTQASTQNAATLWACSVEVYVQPVLATMKYNNQLEMCPVALMWLSVHSCALAYHGIAAVLAFTHSRANILSRQRQITHTQQKCHRKKGCLSIKQIKRQEKRRVVALEWPMVLVRVACGRCVTCARCRALAHGRV